jgi:hypothetical protein
MYLLEELLGNFAGTSRSLSTQLNSSFSSSSLSSTDASSILLSGGKPLKSSLKSCTSVPPVLDSQCGIHLCVQSEPSIHHSQGLQKKRWPASFPAPSLLNLAQSPPVMTIPRQRQCKRPSVYFSQDYDSFPFPRLMAPPTEQCQHQHQPPPSLELDLGLVSAILSLYLYPFADMYMASLTLTLS